MGVNWNSSGCETVNGIMTLPCLWSLVPFIINFAFYLIGAITLILFLYGCLKYIVSTGDQKAVQSAKNIITYSFFGAVFMLCIFAISNFLLGVFGVSYSAISGPNIAGP